MSIRALEDRRVVECGKNVSGPFCARLSADLGADVVKLEARLLAAMEEAGGEIVRGF